MARWILLSLFSIEATAFAPNSDCPYEISTPRYETTDNCVRQITELMQLRTDSLNCLDKLESDAGYSVINNTDYYWNWQEFDPTCVDVDGIQIIVAEPLNSVSSFAYDKLACSNLEDVRKPGSLLAMGSFGLHATGHYDEGSQLGWMGRSDGVASRCLATSLLFAANRNSNSTQQIIFENSEHNMEIESINCAAEITKAWTSCDETSNATITAIRDSLLPYEDALGLLLTGLVKLCLPKGQFGQFRRTLLSYLDYENRFDFEFESGTCSIDWSDNGLKNFFGTYSDVLLEQNGGDEEEVHNKWHNKSAEALVSLAELVSGISVN
jgi:hypothetical protein